MGQIKIITANHLSIKRKYEERASEDKHTKSEVAKEFGRDYWDGPRDYGYGGYQNDGRWKKVAEKLVDQYSLSQTSKILEIGSGKGFLLDELHKVTGSEHIYGIDISEYALENASSYSKSRSKRCDVSQFSWGDKQYDLVISINTLHCLYLPDLWKTLENISKHSVSQYICVESYRNEIEKWNLLRWQLTCEAFFTPSEWCWIFNKCNFKGDYEFIFFE